MSISEYHSNKMVVFMKTTITFSCYNIFNLHPRPL